MTQTSAESYVSKVTKPNDFDDFWGEVLSDLESIPINPEVVQDHIKSTDDVDVFHVTFDSLDNVRIFGWYCLPKKSNRELPAILTVPGYNAEAGVSLNLARKGYAAFDVAPRGKIGSHHQYNPGYPGLLTYNIVDRNTYSYRGFYADAWRAVDFLLSRNEVDSKRIGVQGGSQGGGLTITTAAMRPEIRAAKCSVPYLCGIIDAIELTDTYPYYEITEYLRIHPDSKAIVEETLAYFDVNNFADKVRCPIIVNIGLQDQVCPPQTGYVVFDLLGSKDKNLNPYDGYGHGGGGHIYQPIVDDFFQKHLLPKKD